MNRHINQTSTKRLSRIIALALSCASFNSLATSLTMNDAINLTLSKNPELQSYAHKAEANEGLVQQAGVGQAKKLSVGIEDALGTGSYSGIKGAKTTVSLSWLLEQSILDSKVAVASSKTKLIQLERDSDAIDLAATTAKYFIEVLSLKEQFKLSKLAESQAETALEQIKTLVKRGKLNRITELRAEADLAQKTLVVEDLEHEIVVAKNSLASLWGGSANFTIDGELLVEPQIAAQKTLETKLTQSPAYQLYSARQAITTSKVQLAKATAAPAWEVKTGISRNEAVDDFGFNAGISIPLGGNDRNRGQIIALTSQQKIEQTHAQSWLNQSKAELYKVSVQFSHNQHVIETLSDKIIPTLNDANKLAEQAFKQGRYSYSDWYLIQQELLDNQKQLIETYTNIQLNNIEIQRLTANYATK
ncbi:TolC family protein [Parashewanella tropica]|uniref:TolC family protein n=1 Tax=Parashewanella tropica TaxID=2547970 RepID=UPI00105A5FC6|nr:TolC family protein [Parashewanella tropica]